MQPTEPTDPFIFVKIVIEVIRLIKGGMSKTDAVKAAAKKFTVPENKIWRYGGF